MSIMKSCLLCLAVILTCSEAYKILVVFPMPGKSHSILGDGYVRHLLEDGHEITYISPFPYKSDSPNLRVIDVSANFEDLPVEMLNLEKIMNKEVDMDDLSVMLPMMVGMTKKTIENPNVQKIVQNPKEEFDAVIVEWMFGNIPSAYAALFDCPLIWSSSIDVHWSVLNLIDQYSNPAYTANPMSHNQPPFTFSERLSELWNQIFVTTLRYFYLEPIEKSDYETLIVPLIEKRGRQAPSYSEVQYTGSLMLTNSHPALGQAVPIPQSVKAIGGYHIEENLKPIPDDLKKLLDDAKHGVIYFSMGSNLKSKDIPVKLKQDLLKMFGELKQTVLWKFEEDLPNTPKNVHIIKWAPQPSILAHPNTVLFITHGGLLSTLETVHFGVPVIGIPVFADQFVNVQRAVKKGYAKKIDLSMTMTNELKAAIQEITGNPKYAQTVKDLSAIYHDRPVSPGKELVHWVKHVIKTKGAPHLRSPALNVPFYQKFYLDLLFIIVITLHISVKLLKYACRSFCSKNKIDKVKKNK